MAEHEPESLWAFGDPEPWRRGRFAIGLISALVLFGHAAAAVYSLFNGEIREFFIICVVGCSALFLLFLIWIGQNWARWIISPFFALTGVGMGGRGFLFLLGVAALTIFCYLTFSPAVYAFARRQRESLSFIEILVAGAALLILLALIGSALFAFQLYKSGLEREAVEFAQLTFHRVFTNRDPHFLEDHAASGKKYSRPQEFINRGR